MTVAERRALNKHYADLKTEMSIDTKQLSERSQVKALLANKLALERKLQKLQEENRIAEKRVNEERHSLTKLTDVNSGMRADIRAIETAIAALADKSYAFEMNWVRVGLKTCV